MNKEEVIQKILKEIYNQDSTLILTSDEVKKINDAYKNCLTENKSQISYIDFLYKNAHVTESIGKMQSGRMEIEKQFAKHKALQPAILTECNYAQTLAHIFGLKKCIDLDTATFNEIPFHCVKFIKSSRDSISAARYLYYSTDKDKSEIFLVQYGNPDAGDADIIYFDNDIKIEFKESNAKAGEYDLGLTNDGKLVPSDRIHNEFPAMIDYIEKFNQETCLFDYLGSNYSLKDLGDTSLMKIVKSYFEINKIDLFITSINNELIAIRPQDLEIKIDNDPIANNIGSEIRTTGRNHKTISLQEYFIENIKNISNIKNNICTLQKAELPGFGYVKERGKTSVGRYKINYIFFVYASDIIQDTEETITFDIRKVEQCKPTISIHIQIASDKKKLSKLYK